MPAPKSIHTFAYLVREASGTADRDNKPTFSVSDSIGTVVSCNPRQETDDEIFDKPIGGQWVDYDVIPQRNREITTIELSELSEWFWELLRNVSVSLTGGAASYVPGSTLVHRAWLKLEHKDDAGDLVDSVERWSHVKIEDHNFPKTGIVTARINVRTLYSTLNAGAFTNIT